MLRCVQTKCDADFRGGSVACKATEKMQKMKSGRKQMHLCKLKIFQCFTEAV